MEKNIFDQKSHAVLVAFLLVLAYFFLMFGNGIVSLTHPDEVFYIQTAKEMIAHNSWLTPIIFDKPQFEKPILAYDLFVLAIKAFGLNPFAARFWPAFFGIIGVVLTYILSWILFSNKRQAFFSGFILTTSFIYLALSRAVLTDMIFSVFVLSAMVCFAAAYYRQKYKGSGIVLFFIFSGCAVLAKGILGLIFPWLTVLLFLFYKKDIRFIFNRSAFLGSLLFIVITLPWHILMYQKYGHDFIQEYWNNVHLRRLWEAEHRRLDHGYIYPMVMFLGVFPWSFFLIPAIVKAVDEIKLRNPFRDRLLLVFMWILTVLVPLQFAHSKLASYIFPAIPALAIILAYFLEKNLERSAGPSKTFHRMNYLMCIFLIGLAIASMVMGRISLEFIGSMGLVFICSGLVALLSALIFILGQKKQYVRMLFAYAGIIVIVLIGAFGARSRIEPWVSCKDISDMFNKIDRSGTTVLTSKFYSRGVRYYTDRNIAVLDINGRGFFSQHPVELLVKESSVVDFLNQQPLTFAILREKDVEDIERIIKEQPFQLKELASTGGKYIVRIEKTKPKISL